MINTYADPLSGHKIFESDTDLNYPPDQTRFLNYLGQTADTALEYSALLIEALVGYVDVPDVKKDMIPLAIKAGETAFAHLGKKR